MDWNLITTIVITLFGAFLAWHSKQVEKIHRAESTLRQAELTNIRLGIERVHLRIDEVKIEQKELRQKLEGEDGIFIRLNTLEIKAGVK